MPNTLNINKEDIDSAEKCRNYTVGVIECGKLGTPHACLFADAGFKVIGVNTNPHMLKLLKKGRLPFFEKAHRALEKYAEKGLFIASSEIRNAASESNVVIIAVQTTIDQNKKPDYSLLEKTCREVGMGLKSGSLIIFVCSTGPGIVEGSMREIFEKTSGLKAGRDFGLASSPIQIDSLGGSVEVSRLPRVVGAIDKASLNAASFILSKITKSEITEVSSIKTAEAVNIFQNISNETNQALANELALLCERLRIDFLEILRVAQGNNVFHLLPPGVAHGPLMRDFYLLLEEAENVNSKLRLALLARKTNDEVVEQIFRLVKDALKVCGKTVRRAKVSVLGVSRYPNVKDSPEILTKNVINFIKRKVRTVQVYDPFFSTKELAEFNLESDKLSKVVEKTDCVIILTGHSKFERLNLKKIKFLAKKSPAIVDVGHVIDPLKAEKNGFVYRGLGRGVWTK